MRILLLLLVVGYILWPLVLSGFDSSRKAQLAAYSWHGRSDVFVWNMVLVVAYSLIMYSYYGLHIVGVILIWFLPIPGHLFYLIDVLPPEDVPVPPPPEPPPPPPPPSTPGPSTKEKIEALLRKNKR